uniref:Coenzyme Q-binding protein COQ10 START domain-containing protein n=1 Tax=Aegilops tauschii subsp. strangulata TaxID=200361 RepID=A0A453GVV7_AEGTS
FVSSSPHGRRRLTHTTTAWSPARIRLVSRSAPSRNPLRRSSSSSEPAPGVAGDEGEYVDREVEEDRDERYGFEMEVRKLPGKKNRRLVRARVRVGAPLRAVWATLTDYEGLAGFIPGLSECRLLHQDKAFARLYQVGEQDLALGFKFNAKGTIDCYEGEMELLPESGARRREIDFNMVDGDFKVFQGKWSVQERRAKLIA